MSQGASDLPLSGKARSLANLKPYGKGKSGNPDPANNGHVKRAMVSAFMAEPDPDEPEARERLWYTLDAVYQRSKGQMGSDLAAKLLIEQAIGKAKVSAPEFALALAGHFHQVAKDQVEIGLKLLGDQLNTMSDEQKRAFWDRCERDPRRFLEAAQAEIEGRERGKLP